MLNEEVDISPIRTKCPQTWSKTMGPVEFRISSVDYEDSLHWI
jgi:hypothetical protein